MALVKMEVYLGKLWNKCSRAPSGLLEAVGIPGPADVCAMSACGRRVGLRNEDSSPHLEWILCSQDQMLRTLALSKRRFLYFFYFSTDTS